MDLIERWRAQASTSRAKVVLADAGDSRADAAAARLVDLGLVNVEVMPQEPRGLVTDAIAAFAENLGYEVDRDDPLTVAALMVAAGEADACVAGASRPTADVLRAGLRIIGLAQDSSVVSSAMFVLTEQRATVFADCAVIPDPDADQLASIAISSAQTFASLTDEEPRVAMLSFSTKGSASHELVDKVIEATALAQAKAPDLNIDGELQFDAAWQPEVAARKAPNSTVAGDANVLVFPNLAAANIGYKIAERIGGAKAVGPLLQGLDRTLHDLSRGASVDDIVNLAVLAAAQANPT